MAKEGMIAHICLTDGSVQYRRPDAAAVRRYLGGRGLGMHLLESIADPTPLLFLTGPLTDAAFPPGGRFCAVARCADTGMPVSLSSGSCWGTALKRAGLDGIVIEGEASRWTGLFVENGAVRLFSAQPFLGMLSGETTQALRSTFGPDSSVLCIGLAGENLVPLAAVLCNTGRAFSRAGIGKLMGSKKLKAIVVHTGSTGQVPENACSRCTAACSHALRESNSCQSTRSLHALCNAYGLDSAGTAQAIAAIEKLQHRAAAENAAHWVRAISRRETQLAELAGDGLAALQRVYGAELLPPAPKSAQEKKKQKLPEETAALLDSLGCCLFSAPAFRLQDYAGMLAEASGMHFSPEELLRAGLQILQLEQRIGLHQRFSSSSR